jgi:hypothetical protein
MQGKYISYDSSSKFSLVLLFVIGSFSLCFFPTPDSTALIDSHRQHRPFDKDTRTQVCVSNFHRLSFFFPQQFGASLLP